MSIFLGLPILYMTVPSSRPVIDSIGCIVNPTSCAIDKASKKN